MTNNTLVSKKRVKQKPRGKPFTGADDPRRGRGGRQPNDQSITVWLQKFAGMTGAELAKLCRIYARELEKAGDELPLAALIAIRVLMELINDPDARLLGQALDRIDGKVKQPIELSWREKLEGIGIDPDDAVRQVQEWLSAGGALVESETDSG